MREGERGGEGERWREGEVEGERGGERERWRGRCNSRNVAMTQR